MAKAKSRINTNEVPNNPNPSDDTNVRFLLVPLIIFVAMVVTIFLLIFFSK